jgi:hypothetical protein
MKMYETAIFKDHFPWVDDWDHFWTKRIQNNKRRERILMRGVKIGLKKGGPTATKMSIFDTKKDAPAK